jgi:hypothetical protein
MQGSETGRMGGENKTRFYRPSSPLADTLTHLYISANQFRALEEDEIMFLDSVREKQEEEERQRKYQDGEEVKSFKQCVSLFIVEVLSRKLIFRSTERSLPEPAQRITPHRYFQNRRSLNLPPNLLYRTRGTPKSH